MECCITCIAYYQRETADGMIRKCKIDGGTVHPDDHCSAYEPFVWLTEENYNEWVEKMKRLAEDSE